MACTPRRRFLDALLRRLDADGIDWAVQGIRGSDPAETSLSDIDLVVDPTLVDRADQHVRHAALDTGLLPFRRIDREYTIQVFLAAPDAEGGDAFHVDLCRDPGYLGAPYQDQAAVCRRAERVGRYRYMAPEDEAAYQLFRHLLWGGNPKHLDRLATVAASAPDRLRERLGWAVGIPLASQVMTALAKGPEAVHELLRLRRDLRRGVFAEALIRDPGSLAVGFATFVWTELTFLLDHPAGVLVVVPSGRGDLGRDLVRRLADDRVFFSRTSRFVAQNAVFTALAAPRKLVRARRDYGAVVLERPAGRVEGLAFDTTVAVFRPDCLADSVGNLHFRDGHVRPAGEGARRAFIEYLAREMTEAGAWA